MPKQTTNKKVVASKSGRKISTPIGVLLIAVSAILLAIVGTYGYSKYKESSLRAKAANWTKLGSVRGPSGVIGAWGCMKDDKATVLYVADAQKPYPYVTLNYSYGAGKGEAGRSNKWWGYVALLQTNTKPGSRVSGGHVWSRTDPSNTSIFKDTDPYKWNKC